MRKHLLEIRMNRLVLWILVLGAVPGHLLYGRDPSGQWQGTLPVQGGLRVILKITQEGGKLSATFSSIDQSPEEQPLASVSLEGSTFRFSFIGAADRYEGTISEDGATISGRWYGSRHPGTFYPLDWHLAADGDKWAQDSSPHTVQFVSVAPDVKLEVLDWGGPGRAVVLLAGLGNDAHVFDKFAPKLAVAYHVYGITRRGFGASSQPVPTEGNYLANRLGDDVLAVLDALKIERPVLVGHSIAGEELSSISSRCPEKIAGLIYLDAAYAHAFYDRALGNAFIDANETRRKLLQLATVLNQRDEKPLLQSLLINDLPQLVKSLEQEQKRLNALPDKALTTEAVPDAPKMRYVDAVEAGAQKYLEIKNPALAIFALAPIPSPDAKKDSLVVADAERASQAAQIKAFETGVPSARVVCIPNAEHYVFLSNEAEVLREMSDFLVKLP